MNEEEQDIVEKIREGKRIGIYELIRTFKKEGIENFITVRKKYIDILLNLLETQSKQIDLMATKIYEEGIIWDNLEEVKSYFKKKASEEE